MKNWLEILNVYLVVSFFADGAFKKHCSKQIYFVAVLWFVKLKLEIAFNMPIINFYIIGIIAMPLSLILHYINVFLYHLYLQFKIFENCWFKQ